MTETTTDERIARWGLANEYPFASHFHTVDGHRYHYVDEGTGPVLLFVHGNPTWSFAWRNLIRELRSEYRCIAVDHIGCGLSDKPQDYSYQLADHVRNLKSLVETLDLNGVTLVAHDWGGGIGCGVAGQLPDRFDRLVLMNTAAFRSQRMPKRIAACRIPVLGTLGVRGGNLFALAATTMAIDKTRPMAPAARRGFLAPYDNWENRIAVDRFVKDIPLRAGHPSYATLCEIEESLGKLLGKPILLPWGMKDWCFSPAFLEEFKQRFPSAQVKEFPDAGHYLFEEEPDGLLNAIRDFLKTEA